MKDAEWIATCLQKNLIRGSFVPPLVVQQLRQYNRRVFDLGKQAVYIQNKMDAALQRCNIRISNYVSNVDSKGYLEVVDLLSKHMETSISKDYSLNAHGRQAAQRTAFSIVLATESLYTPQG